MSEGGRSAIDAAELEIIVPSAHPVAVLERTLAALARACDAAEIPRSKVIVVDERPERGISEIVDRYGFRRVVTGGIGSGGARTAGARAGDRPWLVFVDDDVELDSSALVQARSQGADAIERGSLAVIGGIRAPDGAPEWLEWSYVSGTMAPSSTDAGPASLEPVHVSVALLLIARDTLEAVDGFPDMGGWGWVDAVLGLSLEKRFGRSARIRREPSISGVHWYGPTWEEWLERQVRAGARLAELEGSLSAGWSERLHEITSLEGGIRAGLKRAAGYVPPVLWPKPRSRSLARFAASAAFARGYRRAKHDA